MHRKGIGPRGIGAANHTDCGCPHAMMIVITKKDGPKTKRNSKKR